MTKSKTTMRDIAAAADVSVTTVWMVIHDKPGISLGTAEKVWSAINALNYQPRKVENSSQLDTVALLIEQSTIPVISDVFYGDVIRGSNQKHGGRECAWSFRCSIGISGDLILTG